MKKLAQRYEFACVRVDIFANQGLSVRFPFPFTLFGKDEDKKIAAFAENLDTEIILQTIANAVNGLKEQGCAKIFLVGWSNGATYGILYANKNPGIIGICGISPVLVPDGKLARSMPIPGKFDLHQLYIYGTEDTKVPSMQQDILQWVAASPETKVQYIPLPGDHAFDTQWIGLIPIVGLYRPMSTKIAHTRLMTWISITP